MIEEGGGASRSTDPAAGTSRCWRAFTTVVAAKGGEELRFVKAGNWQPAEVRQDLLDGDSLRTNAIGNLAILFADRTQIRVGRNSTLTVRDVAAGQRPFAHRHR